MIILYVSDQVKSRDFYRAILGKEPFLDVPGMTEFEMNKCTLLGLMPEEGIAKILGNKTPDPKSGNGIPRCEIYFSVKDVDTSFQKFIENGGVSISPPEIRNWGHNVAYGADPDGNIIAFASEDN